MTAVQELWQKMLTQLETEISAVNFDVWIKTLEPVQSSNGRLVLCASNANIRNFVTDKFKDAIARALNTVNPLLSEVAIIDPSNRESYTEKEVYILPPEPEVPYKIEATVITPRYNFENFVVGKSNQFMYAAARAVSDEPGIRYNPLFIYGGAGLGKTHIMHAIGNSLRMSHPNLKVLYASSEKFLNEFIESIRAAKAKSTHFREKYRAVDVLMIDDIQFIAGKPETQQEMFHTFNELHAANKQLVFTSDRPPKEIPDLEERLRSRFEWGLMADVQQPDLETRVAILQKKAELEKYNIAPDILAFMAENMSSNVRDMESLLNKVIFLSRLYDQEPDIGMVKEALKDYADKTEESITADRVMECVCKYFNVSMDDLTGKKKNREIVEPRQICMFLIHDIVGIPLASIGNLFGGRDHTTVMHARDKILQLSQNNIKVKVSLSDIRETVFKKM